VSMLTNRTPPEQDAKMMSAYKVIPVAEYGEVRVFRDGTNGTFGPVGKNGMGEP